MSQTGSPITSTTYQQARAKVSDGKSVRVSVPANSGDIAAGQICYFGGFLGFAMTDLTNSATAAQDLILQIGIAEYETDVIDTSKTFAAGTKIYWDDTEKELTETETAVFAGVVSAAKDDNNVIWFILTPGIVNAAETDAIGALTELDTTAKTSVVDAINEVDTNADAAAAAAAAVAEDVGDLADLDTTEKTTAVGAINEVNTNADAAAAAAAAVAEDVGDLADLDTTAKTSVVDAINEVDTNADAANTAIGTLASLTTTEKTNLVGAVNEVDADVATALGRVATNVACAADADAEAVRTALIGLLAALEATGLMAGAGD